MGNDGDILGIFVGVTVGSAIVGSRVGSCDGENDGLLLGLSIYTNTIQKYHCVFPNVRSNLNVVQKQITKQQHKNLL